MIFDCELRPESRSMTLDPIKINAMQSTLLHDSQAFLPELILCGAIVLLLFMRLFSGLDRWHLGWVALAFTLCGLAISAIQWEDAITLEPVQPIFSGLLIYDNFTIFLRLFLLGFAALIIGLTLLSG